VGAAQYKFLDFLSIPVLIFSGVALSELKIKWTLPVRIAAAGVLVLFIVLSLCMQLWFNGSPYHYSMEISAFDSRYSNAAAWLRENREDYSRVLLLDESSIEKPVDDFSSELVFSQLSGKYPLDGTISDLEEYSAEYKQQLKDRELILREKDSAQREFLMNKYDVKYVVGKSCGSKVIYEDDFTKICELI
jgi:uncharacterized membrane protein